MRRLSFLLSACVVPLASFGCGSSSGDSGGDTSPTGADELDSASDATASGSESDSGMTSTTTATTTEGSDSDGVDDGMDDADSGPKFDLPAIPDGGGDTGGGEIGIPTTCAKAADVASAVGCEFFGLDLNNLADGEFEQFGFIVSNVQTDEPAEVYVEEKQGGNWATVSGPEVIQPLDSHSFLLPDNHQEGSGLKVGGAYRITSDTPVVAYQFNPIDGQISFTTDASLLYPVASWTHIHQILGYHVTIGASSYINVVGAVDGTQVEVTVTSPTVAGAGIPAGVPGVPFMIELDEGDVAQIATTTNANASMTGTLVLTDEDYPVGVFTGTECTNTGMGACDHLEEMLTGVQLWGSEFVASRMPVRNVNAPEQTLWQIYASEDDTVVELEADPEVSGLPGSPIMLDKGQKVEFLASGTVANPGDFHILADKPIAVMSYMIGIDSGEGDPAMVQMSPVQQYLPIYVLLVPPTWINDYLVITRLAGAQVELDGAMVDDSAFVPVGNGDYEVARLLTPDGVHVVDGLGDPCSVTVVGFDSYDSYAYLGGVGTSVINPNPQG
ncbi:IgGFc-binding protein [Nannocystaceae bacterium ST9]